MKLGVTQWTLDVKGVATVARAAELGFQYVQLDAGGWTGWPEKLDRSKQEAYEQAAQEAAVEIIAIGVNPLNEISLLAPIGSQEQRQAQALVTDAIEAAQRLGAALVYVPGFHASEMKSQQDIIQTAAVLADLANIAADHGVQLASENTLSAEQQLLLLAEASHPNVKLFIDTQNPVIFGHDVSQLITQLEAHLCGQMHLKDGVNGLMGNSLLGEGEADFQKTAKTIKTLQLKPLFVLENAYDNDARLRTAKDQATAIKALAS